MIFLLFCVIFYDDKESTHSKVEASRTGNFSPSKDTRPSWCRQEGHFLFSLTFYIGKQCNKEDSKLDKILKGIQFHCTTSLLLYSGKPVIKSREACPPCHGYFRADYCSTIPLLFQITIIFADFSSLLSQSYQYLPCYIDAAQTGRIYLYLFSFQSFSI